MKIKIFQINLGRDEKRVAFLEFGLLKEFQKTDKINSSIYDCVFEGEVNCKDLEDVFQMFNCAFPDCYKGRSLSVSDIVEVVESDAVKAGFYYCDNIGFLKVDFNPEEAEPLKENKIRVLMVEPGKKAYETEIGTSLQELYSTLDCECIQTLYPYDDLIVIVCDDEGKLNRSRPNRAIYDEDGKMLDIIFGNFFICDCSTTEFASLPDEMIKKYKDLFYLPERFVKVGNEIVPIKYNPEDK